jgi:SAM-dependent methyltransferase
VAGERARLRTTFDEAASLYDEVRPGYPVELFDDVVSLSRIPAGGRILEIGCGTGQATVPLARRGYRILCVELGENMVAVARRNLEGYPQTEVQTGTFQAWHLQEAAFDLAVSATAFHWLDPEVAYPKVARALHPQGALALFWNVHVHTDAAGGFFEEAQKAYEREAPEIVGPDDYNGPPLPEEVPSRTPEIEGPGLFKVSTTRQYRWDEPYDATGYLRVLNTYSGHRSLSNDARERLFRGIVDLMN